MSWTPVDGWVVVFCVLLLAAGAGVVMLWPSAGSVSWSPPTLINAAIPQIT